VFSGTPKAFGKRVSVAVDLSMTGDDNTTLVFTHTGVLTGPNTANEPVPDDKRDAVLAAFAGKLPDQRLPFGVAPTTEGARGSDVIETQPATASAIARQAMRTLMHAVRMKTAAVGRTAADAHHVFVNRRCA